ncbi:MAG: peptidylprolyl isomerase, partial [Acidobacteriota bacterium]|nr:peptidylprolyl isomerase [Acidobacteriota bacterium]
MKTKARRQKKFTNHSQRSRRVLSSTLALIAVSTFVVYTGAQEPKRSESLPGTPKKINTRPPEVVVSGPDPFDGAAVEKMAQQCVTLETESGAIEIGMIPEVAPESVRNFLNLAATRALDTTTFSRVVKD